MQLKAMGSEKLKMPPGLTEVWQDLFKPMSGRAYSRALASCESKVT